MATDAERDRLRADIGANETSLPDPDADAIFEEAGEKYSVAGQSSAYARVIAIRRILASSARLVSYRQNNSSENSSDVSKNLQALLKIWQDALEGEINTPTGGRVRIGGLRQKPKRIKEYPGS